MAEPAYVTIAEGYARQIRNGALTDEAQLPSHAELAARHGVSRSVIRQAIQLLTSQQLVRTVPRRGTFVIGQRPVARPETPALDDDVDEIRAVAHPIRRAQLAGNLITHYQLRIAELSGIRQTAIEDAHDHGMSIADIGERLGLSNGHLPRVSR
ncbi:regulatory GntR family protein [Nocardia tenerifensis]|uniref:Regulatory GntR family protein n=1 Tax=Nocardia tenerifensis TaxID=228006 RepID=A0A318K022_9NOCA|nr:winged helix-turn-helix domain-containing protein [Nocardia tenerifensis]PXX60356.1 regulatory GntR family protein [Nocardia tenerifensis]